jgi:hypothetical protein
MVLLCKLLWYYLARYCGTTLQVIVVLLCKLLWYYFGSYCEMVPN